jgi:hypothetical protein
MNGAVVAFSDLNDFYVLLKSHQSGSGRIHSVRDLTRIHLDQHYSLIVAVDSDGGIGPMEADTVFCPAYELGRFAIRVPLVEILCSGAIPLAAYDMLTMKMEGVGAEILRGIRDELKLAGYGEDFHLSGSTEDNVPTKMTGVGTTIIGLVHSNDFRPGSSQPEDRVACLGLPKSAPEDTVRTNDPEIMQQSDLKVLLEISGVHDILPVGSHGIGYEADAMAKAAGLAFVPDADCRLSFQKSAGPSTCVIASCMDGAIKLISKQINAPVTLMGKMSKIK